jgi:hypothetical protein
LEVSCFARTGVSGSGCAGRRNGLWRRESAATSVATLLFYLFLAGFVIALLLGLITGRKTAS